MLKNHQKRQLRALAHSRKPVVIIGAKGPTESVLAELSLALDHHELVKVKIQATDRNERQAIIEHLCQATQAQLIQRLGHIATLYRADPEAPRIRLS